jgi:hypothetical protein
MRLVTLARGWFLVSVTAVGSARADAPTEGETFTSSLRGLTLRPEGGTGIYGYELTGNLGGTSAGARTLSSGAYLLQWTGDAEGVLGAAAYEHPYRFVYGLQAQGQGEAAWRLRPGEAWSPVLSARVSATGSVIRQSIAPVNGGDRVNNGGDLLGALATGQLALGGGASLLDSTRSLLVEAALLLEGDSAQSDLPGRGFLGAILHARYDAPDQWLAIGEAWFAFTPSQGDSALQTSTQTTRWGLSLSGLRRFGSHFLGGVAFRLQRDDTTVSYQGGLSYDTAPPIEARVSLTAGYSP